MLTEQRPPFHAALARRSPSPRSLGGALGNGRLTAIIGAVLLVLLAVEGATILRIGQLLSVHIFVGMLLIGPIALKLAAAGYRFGRYYTHGPEYVREGPPVALMRFLVAPVLVFSTVVLFGTGVTLLLVPHRGPVLLLHKASFIVWLGATSIHVLVYGPRAGRRLLSELRGERLEGARLRIAAALAALAGGALLAVFTYPLAHPWLQSHGFSFGG